MEGVTEREPESVSISDFFCLYSTVYYKRMYRFVDTINTFKLSTKKFLNLEKKQKILERFLFENKNQSNSLQFGTNRTKLRHLIQYS